MRDFLRRKSASQDSDGKDVFGVTRSLMNTATTLKSTTLLFAIFCSVGIAVSATYVLILQKVIAADSDIFLRAIILIVLCISAICAIFLLRIASELDDIRRLQDRYHSIGLRTLFEFGDPPGEKVAPDVIDRLLSIDPLLRKEVDAGRAEIQYDVVVKAGGLAFSFDAVISGKRRLVLVRSFADQGRKIDEADIAKLSEEIRDFIATAQPRRVDVFAVWRNNLTEQAVGFSLDDEKWRASSGCRMLRTMIFVSGKGYQIASAPSEAIAKEDAEKGTEAPYAIAYATAQKGRARKRAALSSIAMASILILAALAIASIWINESILPGPGGDGTNNMEVHDPIAIMGDSGINNASGVRSGNGTADDPYIIEGWSINTSNSTAIAISDTTAHIIIRNMLIESPGINNTNGISIYNSMNCRIYNVSIDSHGAQGIRLWNTTQISIADSSIKNGSCGILVVESNGISISDCDVQTDESSYIGGGLAMSPGGIGVMDSSEISIVNTTIANSFDIGAHVASSSQVSIINLTCGITHILNGHDVSVTNSIIRGMIFFWGSNITLSGNDASGATPVLLGSNPYGTNAVPKYFLGNGISFWRSNGISILNNIASFNTGDGITIENCTNIDVQGNTASSNVRSGINLTNSVYVTIDLNHFTSLANVNQSTGAGLSMNSCSNVTLKYNLIQGNIYSVMINNSVDILIHHNAFVGNGLSAFTPFEGINISGGSTGLWDNGYPSGGNYYSDLTGVDNFSGPSQNIAGSDGIIDTSLNLGGGNVDRYPLVSPPAI